MQNAGSATFRDYLEQAFKAHQARELDKAEYMYNTLLTNDVGNPLFCYYLATLYMERGQYGLAAQLLSHTVKAQPEGDIYPAALNNLGICFSRTHNTDIAVDTFLKAGEVEPDNAHVWANLAACYVNSAAPDKMLEYTTKALNIDPENVDAHWNRALALLEQGNFKLGWKEHEWRLHEDARNSIARRAYRDTLEKWDGSRKRVVIHGEQGLGDEIMFASCIPDAIAAAEHVVIECAPRLEGLFKRSFPEATVVGTHEGGVHDVEAWSALGSLPLLFKRYSWGDFPRKPYLKAKEGPQKDKFRIGVAWQGGITNTRIDLRSVQISQFAPLFRDDCEFVSLQYTTNATKETEGMPVKHWPAWAESKDMDDVAALVGSCDLVISVCQTAIHVAGALGVPCWVLVPSKPSWRYLAPKRGDGPQMPWYGSVKLYRQQDSWDDLINRVAKELDAYLGRLPGAKPDAA